MKDRNLKIANPRIGELKEKVRNLPEAPGIYIMRDRLGNIIYVGKSYCLKKRVSQYFGSLKNKPPKVSELVSHIDNFEYIVTDTELDALLLESSLIKELRPMYNSQLKNDRKYPFIKITMEEEYPRLLAVIEKEADGSIYFGPYTNPNTVEKAITFIKDSFPIRKCITQVLPKGSSGCLHHHLYNCMGACRGQTSRIEYMSYIQEIIALLEGRNQQPVRALTAEMEAASERLDFELAARLRDQLSAVKHLLNRQKTISSALKRENIISIEDMGSSSIKLFFIRGSRLLYHEIIDLKLVDKDSLRELLISYGAEHFVPRAGEKSERPTQQDIDEAQIIFSYIRSKSPLYLKIPQSWLSNIGKDKLEKGISDLVNKICDKMNGSA